MSKKIIHYWIKGNNIYSCFYERSGEKCCKIHGEELVKRCSSEKEAKKELEKLEKEYLKH